ncbi:MAG: hypothetical protein M3O78_01020 [Chloroflexota bacterium]|nr:hypothetical protein [Chloroflexota bacterium]
MSIRLDPRRLGALKLLAAEAGVRPGELVTRWVEERLDAARSGGAPMPAGSGEALTSDLAAAINARIDALGQRLDKMAGERSAGPAPASPASANASAAEVQAVEPKRRRGRPPKAAQVASAGVTPARRRAGGMAARSKAPRVALHDEIAAVIAERGPQTATELAAAIAERGRYHAPRSARPLDGAIVNARVSNPKYRPRFVRRARRIGLAEPTTE